MTVSHLFCTLALCATSLIIASPASAQDYPSKPVRIIVPYPPGGGADDVARTLAVRLGERLKQPVLIDNRGGATGMIGTNLAKAATPDGYTLLFAHADTLSVNPHARSNPGYDARQDFVPVSILGARPFVLAVNHALAVKNATDFVRLAKEQPGKLTYGSQGNASTPQIAMLMLADQTKVELLHVPYQGAAPMMMGLLAGQIDSTMGSLTVIAPHYKADKVRVLGITTAQRLSSVPEIPTLVEQGIPVTIVDWYGIVAPAKTPPAVLEVLNRELNALLVDPEFKSFLTNKVGMQVSEPLSLAQAKQYVASAYDTWGKTIRAANLKLD